MKNNKLTFLKIAIVAVFGVTILIGCEKNQEILEKNEAQKTNSKSNEEIGIDVLRKYFAERIGATLERITFDEKTEQFRLSGIDQMSKKDLEESYQNNFLNAKEK